MNKHHVCLKLLKPAHTLSAVGRIFNLFNQVFSIKVYSKIRNASFAGAAAATKSMPATRVRTRSQTQQQPLTVEQQQIADLHQKLQQQTRDIAKLNSDLDQAGAARAAAGTAFEPATEQHDCPAGHC